MAVIALTGGIASGKSTVAAMLARRGARVVDADKLAREVVEPGSAGLAEVVACFGDAIVGEDGSLDRERLGAIVFANAAQRRMLEAITHPRILMLTSERIAQALADSPPVVVVDIPLLMETRRDRDFSGVLVVYANEATQIQRLMARDGLDEPEARRRLAAQLPIDDKRDRATWTIDNSASLPSTEHQVDDWWRLHAVSTRPQQRDRASDQ